MYKVLTKNKLSLEKGTVIIFAYDTGLEYMAVEPAGKTIFLSYSIVNDLQPFLIPIKGTYWSAKNYNKFISPPKYMLKIIDVSKDYLYYTKYECDRKCKDINDKWSLPFFLWQYKWEN